MRLLKPKELEWYQIAKKALQILEKDTISEVIIEDLTLESLKGLNIDFDPEVFTIKNSKLISDVVIIIKLKCELEFRYYNNNLVLALILIYFPKDRWDITDKIKKVLTLHKK